MSVGWCVVFGTFLTVTDSLKNFVPCQEQDKTLQVETTDGLIQGISDKTDTGFKFYSFVGVPFAQPPLGNLRFRAPKPLEKWENVLDARVPGNCCAGLNLRELSLLNFQYEGEEDCLYLNVYTPSLQKPNNHKPLKPVMVFFYGGGFMAGCADRSFYGPDFLIIHDIVLVTVNYRLSIFGGLSTEDEECPGNWALKDQIATLKWVQKNIEKFQGDPNRVTIFGQSAGAASVNFLMLSPLTKGLFHAAILESGSVLSPWSNLKHSRQLAFDLGVAAGIKTNSSKELLARLRGLTTIQLKEAQIPPIIVTLIQGLDNGLPYGPQVKYKKNGVLLENSFDAMERGHYHKVPVMMGLNSMELLYFDGVMKLILSIKPLGDVTPSLFSRNIERPEDRYRVGKLIRSFFVKSDSYAEATVKEMYQLFSSDLFIRPLSKTASLLGKHGTVYFYYFTFTGFMGLAALKYLSGLQADERPVHGTGHAEELPYLFKTNMTPPMNQLPIEEQMTVKKMTKLWTNFAKFGNPTPRSDPELDNAIWPTVLTNQPPFVKNYLELGDKLTPHYQNFAEEEVLFWENVYQKYRKKPYNGY